MTSGVKQWVFQRVANAVFVSFGACLLYVFLSGDGLSYGSLKATFDSAWKWYFATVLVLACLNSVLAAWQIDGDYAKKFGIAAWLITVTALVVSLIYLFFGLGLIF
ncbi:MAG: hypothetical protein AAFZ92_11365 [Pseudomonadota bacterium]